MLADRVQKCDLQAKPDQIKAMIRDYAQSFDHPEDVVRWYASDAKRMQEVENLVLEENVVDWAMSQARTVNKTAEFNELMGNT